nr:EOG090X0A3R [Ilyocryptus agilis]
MEHENDFLRKNIAALKKEMLQEVRQIEVLENDIRQLNEQVYQTKFSAEEKEILCKSSTDELERLEQKIKRAEDLNISMQKRARKARKTKKKLDEELDFEIAQLREKCQTGPAMMMDATGSHPGARVSLVVYMEETANAILTAGLVEEKPTVSVNKMRLDITDFPTSAASTGSSRESAEVGRFSYSNNASRRKPCIEEIQNKRISVFDKELKRQQALITRLEKIQVNYQGYNDETTTLIMNKSVSTPYNCAQHLGELLTKRSVVAEVDGELWDMHRPLQSDCSLKLLHIKVEDPHLASMVNKVFWRSCSFLLGAVVQGSFKDNVAVQLHSFPSANVRSGSFVYDVQLDIDNWQPSQDDFRIFSASFRKFAVNNYAFQRLDVDSSLALQMFENNTFKAEQIPDIAGKSNDGRSVTVYRLGDHIDISRGPMIANTSLVGRATIASVHKLDAGLYRFQGVALPSDIFLNHFAYSILEARARKLNPARIPVMHAEAET